MSRSVPTRAAIIIVVLTALMCAGVAYGNPAAASGYTFTGWSGASTSTSSCVTITMSQDRSLTANFQQLATGTISASDTSTVLVSGGTFTMGCTSEQGSDCHSDESPSHSVTVSSFRIMKYEVTQKLWRDVMGTSARASCGNAGIGDDHPVYCVSWNDIVTNFIPALNARTGKTYRLPTEAEWEYAARGGNQSQGYKYSGSNNIGDVAWYSGNSSSGTKPAGTKQPNELGIYDMSGNVWEWVHDWWGSYTSGAKTNPTGPSSGSNRVLRGGSWLYGTGDCRVSFRDYFAPGLRNGNVGFRLVLSP